MANGAAPVLEPSALSGVFCSTHQAPTPAIATFSAPDAALAPGPTLTPGIDVQVLEQRADGWAEIRCENGWIAWVDGRLLRPRSFVVPSSGLPAWAAPDPGLDPSARLDPLLQVRVLERHTEGWARIVCDNGWTAWVDGRRLTVAETDRSGRAQAAPARVSATDRTWLPLAGGALILLGAVLPWYSVFGTDIGSWDLSLRFLIFRTPTNDEPVLGWALVVAGLLVTAYALLPIATGRRASRWMLLLGSALATNMTAFALVRWLHPETGLGLASGPLVTAVGGIVAAVAHFRTRDRTRRGAWGWL